MQATIDEPPKAKRPRAKKIKKPLGPFQTECTCFDKGTRDIELVLVTAKFLVYRLKGRNEEFILGHESAFMRAVSGATGFNTAARETTRIKRGEATG